MGKKRPTISVLLPVYNAAPYLRECVESLFNQTYGDFEIVAFDDGSGDDSRRVLEQLASEDQRLRIFGHEHNQGIVSVLNEAFNYCQGKYIARMDADDVTLPERLKTHIEFLKANPSVDIVGSWIQLFGSKDEVWHYRQHDDFIKALLLFRTNGLPHNSLLARREVFERFTYTDQYPHIEDTEMWVRMMLSPQPVTFANIPKVLTRYRIYPHQVSELHSASQTDAYERLIKSLLYDITGEELTPIEWQCHSNLIAGKPIYDTSMEAQQEWYQKLSKSYGKHFSDSFFVISEKWVKYCRQLELPDAIYKPTLTCHDRFEFL